MISPETNQAFTFSLTALYEGAWSITVGILPYSVYCRYDQLTDSSLQQIWSIFAVNTFSADFLRVYGEGKAM